MDDLTLGESGRPRIAHDRYAEPLENIAGLAIGLRKAKITLPRVMLDPCAGTGGLCRGLMDLAPGVRVCGSDLHPELVVGANVYSVASPVDATIVADLEMALKLTRATGIVSNPPYERRLNPAIIQAGLTLLRRRVISVLILMQKAHHGLSSDVGYRETTDPFYTLMIACTWRTRLFTPQPGDPQPKYSHVWHVWTERGREDPDFYPVCPINLPQVRAWYDRVF